MGVTEGASYRFKVRAVNIYGAGPDSAEGSIRASDVPSRMASVATVRSGTDIIAGFVKPNENGHFRGLHVVLIKPEEQKACWGKVFDTYKSSKAFDEFV